MIQTRNEACRILGVRPDADQATVKTAYKNLVKCYHPDAGDTQDIARYEQVLEAYEYLSSHPYVLVHPFAEGQSAPTQQANTSATANATINNRGAKILGGNTPAYKQGANYASFERKYQQRKEEKAQDFEYRMEEYRKMQEIAEAERKKREEEYARAMEIIRSIRMAEAIKTMIHSPLDTEDHKTP